MGFHTESWTRTAHFTSRNREFVSNTGISSAAKRRDLSFKYFWINPEIIEHGEILRGFFKIHQGRSWKKWSRSVRNMAGKSLKETSKRLSQRTGELGYPLELGHLHLVMVDSS